jgi:hypothetical protein
MPRVDAADAAGAGKIAGEDKGDLRPKLMQAGRVGGEKGCSGDG